MELDSLYQEVILDHYKHPQHKGLNPVFTAQVSHVITSITWDGQGCSISQASVSMLSDLVTDKTLEQADAIVKSFSELMASKGTAAGDPEVLEDAVVFAGVSKFPGRVKCALLGWMAFKDAAIQSQGESK
jgi:nitrogen fixation NifU-like protein